MLAWLGHYGHLSYAKQQEWLRELGQIEVSLGTLEATTRRVVAAVEALKQWVARSYNRKMLKTLQPLGHQRVG